MMSSLFVLSHTSLTQLEQRIAELEAENKELLGIADNTALILAGHRIVELEETVAELSETIIRLVTTGRAVINHPCEVNWTALQYNLAEASNLVNFPEPEDAHTAEFYIVDRTSSTFASFWKVGAAGRSYDLHQAGRFSQEDIERYRNNPEVLFVPVNQIDQGKALKVVWNTVIKDAALTYAEAVSRSNL